MERQSPVKIPGLWVKEPSIKTRTELMSLRKSQILPDLSFDLDGDGVVGAHDLVLASQFDKDKDGKLNAVEREQAMRALSQGFSQKFVWGCESSGLNRSFRLVQKRGKVINDEDFGVIRDTYPKYATNDKTLTRSQLEEFRKKQDREEAKKNELRINTVTKKELTADEFLCKEHYVDTPQYNSIAEKKEIDRKVARGRVGLTDEPKDIKIQQVLYEYKRDPRNLSLTEMKNKQRESLIQNLNATADFNHVTFYEKVEKEKNFGGKTGRNLRDVVSERKKRDVGHLEETFTQKVSGIHGKELPKFGENLKGYDEFAPDNSVFNPFEGYKNQFYRSEERGEEISMKPTQVLHEVGENDTKNKIVSKFSDYYVQFMPHTGKSQQVYQEKLRLSQVKIGEKKQFRFLSHNEITPPITQRLLQKVNSPSSKFKNITSTGFTFK